MTRPFSPKLLAVLISLTLIWTSGGVLDAALAAPDLFVGPSSLPQFQLMPPGQLGRVVDYYNAEGVKKGKSEEGKNPLVILIQDLHAHYGVQKNIAGLLDFLANKLASVHPSSSLPPSIASSLPFALAVEGASGPIDSSVMALFPDEKVKLAASDYLMREGELTGAEYFAIKRGIPNLLVGAENEKYYLVHRDLFRKTLADRNELVSQLKAIQHDINELPRYVFHKNKALWEFQQQVEAYDKGEISTHEFIGLLMNKADTAATSEDRSNGRSAVTAEPPQWQDSRNDRTTIDLKRDFPTLAAFAANSQFGTMDQVRAATASFLTQIQSNLSAQEKADLKLLAKNNGTTTYYLYLRELIYKKQLFLAVPPELAQYLEYIHTAQTMGMDRVIHEAKELAFRIKLRLAAVTADDSRNGSAAVDLVQVQHDLDLLLRLADLQATEYEVRDFAPRLNQFVALTKALLAKTERAKGFDEISIRRLISSSIDFYVMALLRNKPMIENTLGLLSPSPAPSLPRSSPPSVAVLVAGGFHTIQLTNMLREKNVSYLVISPTIDKVTDADRTLYVKRLSGNHLTEQEILTDGSRKSPEWVQSVKVTGGPDIGDSGFALAKLWSFSKGPSSQTLAIGFGNLTHDAYSAALNVAGNLFMKKPIPFPKQPDRKPPAREPNLLAPKKLPQQEESPILPRGSKSGVAGVVPSNSPHVWTWIPAWLATLRMFKALNTSDQPGSRLNSMPGASKPGLTPDDAVIPRQIRQTEQPSDLLDHKLAWILLPLAVLGLNGAILSSGIVNLPHVGISPVISRMVLGYFDVLGVPLGLLMATAFSIGILILTLRWSNGRVRRVRPFSELGSADPVPVLTAGQDEPETPNPQQSVPPLMTLPRSQSLLLYIALRLYALGYTKAPDHLLNPPMAKLAAALIEFEQSATRTPDRDTPPSTTAEGQAQLWENIPHWIDRVGQRAQEAGVASIPAWVLQPSTWDRLYRIVRFDHLGDHKLAMTDKAVSVFSGLSPEQFSIQQQHTSDRRGSGHATTNRPFGLAGHVIALGVAVAVAMTPFWIFRHADIEMETLTQTWEIMVVVSFVLPIAFSFLLSALTQLFTPKDFLHDPETLDQSWFENGLKAAVRRGFIFPTVSVRTAELPHGRAAETDLSDPAHPIVRIAPWLASKDGGMIVHALRRVLRPLVLAHEIRRLENRPSWEIYLKKNLIDLLFKDLLAGSVNVNALRAKLQSQADQVSLKTKLEGISVTLATLAFWIWWYAGMTTENAIFASFEASAVFGIILVAFVFLFVDPILSRIFPSAPESSEVALADNDIAVTPEDPAAAARVERAILQKELVDITTGGILKRLAKGPIDKDPSPEAAVFCLLVQLSHDNVALPRPIRSIDDLKGAFLLQNHRGQEYWPYRARKVPAGFFEKALDFYSYIRERVQGDPQQKTYIDGGPALHEAMIILLQDTPGAIRPLPAELAAAQGQSRVPAGPSSSRHSPPPMEPQGPFGPLRRPFSRVADEFGDAHLQHGSGDRDAQLAREARGRVAKKLMQILLSEIDVTENKIDDLEWYADRANLRIILKDVEKAKEAGIRATRRFWDAETFAQAALASLSDYALPPANPKEREKASSVKKALDIFDKQHPPVTISETDVRNIFGEKIAEDANVFDAFRRARQGHGGEEAALRRARENLQTRLNLWNQVTGTTPPSSDGQVSPGPGRHLARFDDMGDYRGGLPGVNPLAVPQATSIRGPQQATKGVMVGVIPPTLEEIWNLVDQNRQAFLKREEQFYDDLFLSMMANLLFAASDEVRNQALREFKEGSESRKDIPAILNALTYWINVPGNEELRAKLLHPIELARFGVATGQDPSGLSTPKSSNIRSVLVWLSRVGQTIGRASRFITRTRFMVPLLAIIFTVLGRAQSYAFNEVTGEATATFTKTSVGASNTAGEVGLKILKALGEKPKGPGGHYLWQQIQDAYTKYTDYSGPHYHPGDMLHLHGLPPDVLRRLPDVQIISAPPITPPAPITPPTAPVTPPAPVNPPAPAPSPAPGHWWNHLWDSAQTWFHHNQHPIEMIAVVAVVVALVILTVWLIRKFAVPAYRDWLARRAPRESTPSFQGLRDRSQKIRELPDRWADRSYERQAARLAETKSAREQALQNLEVAREKFLQSEQALEEARLNLSLATGVEKGRVRVDVQNAAEDYRLAGKALDRAESAFQKSHNSYTDAYKNHLDTPGRGTAPLTPDVFTPPAVPPTSSSGSLRRIRVSQSGVDLTNEALRNELVSRHDEFTGLPHEIRSFTFLDQKLEANVVRTHLGNRIGGYQFTSNDGVQWIVLNDQLSPQVQDEALFHEQREIGWQTLGFSQAEAHTLASYEQASTGWFVNHTTGLTQFHTAELNGMNPNELRQLINEYQSGGRLRHHALIAEALSRSPLSYLDLQKAEAYERRFIQYAVEHLSNAPVASENRLSGIERRLREATLLQTEAELEAAAGTSVGLLNPRGMLRRLMARWRGIPNDPAQLNTLVENLRQARFAALQEAQEQIGIFNGVLIGRPGEAPPTETGPPVFAASQNLLANPVDEHRILAIAIAAHDMWRTSLEGKLIELEAAINAESTQAIFVALPFFQLLFDQYNEQEEAAYAERASQREAEDVDHQHEIDHDYWQRAREDAGQYEDTQSELVAAYQEELQKAQEHEAQLNDKAQEEIDQFQQSERQVAEAHQQQLAENRARLSAAYKAELGSLIQTSASQLEGFKARLDAITQHREFSALAADLQTWVDNRQALLTDPALEQSTRTLLEAAINKQQTLFRQEEATRLARFRARAQERHNIAIEAAYRQTEAEESREYVDTQAALEQAYDETAAQARFGAQAQQEQDHIQTDDEIDQFQQAERQAADERQRQLADRRAAASVQFVAARAALQAIIAAYPAFFSEAFIRQVAEHQATERNRQAAEDASSYKTRVSQVAFQLGKQERQEATLNLAGDLGEVVANLTRQLSTLILGAGQQHDLQQAAHLEEAQQDRESLMRQAAQQRQTQQDRRQGASLRRAERRQTRRALATGQRAETRKAAEVDDSYHQKAREDAGQYKDTQIELESAHDRLAQETRGQVQDQEAQLQHQTDEEIAQFQQAERDAADERQRQLAEQRTAASARFVAARAALQAVIAAYPAFFSEAFIRQVAERQANERNRQAAEAASFYKAGVDQVAFQMGERERQDAALNLAGDLGEAVTTLTRQLSSLILVAGHQHDLQEAARLESQQVRESLMWQAAQQHQTQQDRRQSVSLRRAERRQTRRALATGQRAEDRKTTEVDTAYQQKTQEEADQDRDTREALEAAHDRMTQEARGQAQDHEAQLEQQTEEEITQFQDAKRQTAQAHQQQLAENRARLSAAYKAERRSLIQTSASQLEGFQTRLDAITERREFSALAADLQTWVNNRKALLTDPALEQSARTLLETAIAKQQTLFRQEADARLARFRARAQERHNTAIEATYRQKEAEESRDYEDTQAALEQAYDETAAQARLGAQAQQEQDHLQTDDEIDQFQQAERQAADEQQRQLADRRAAASSQFVAARAALQAIIAAYPAFFSGPFIRQVAQRQREELARVEARRQGQHEAADAMASRETGLESLEVALRAEQAERQQQAQAAEAERLRKTEPMPQTAPVAAQPQPPSLAGNFPEVAQQPSPVLPGFAVGIPADLAPSPAGPVAMPQPASWDLVGPVAADAAAAAFPPSGAALLPFTVTPESPFPGLEVQVQQTEEQARREVERIETARQVEKTGKITNLIARLRDPATHDEAQKEYVKMRTDAAFGKVEFSLTDLQPVEEARALLWIEQQRNQLTAASFARTTDKEFTTDSLSERTAAAQAWAAAEPTKSLIQGNSTVKQAYSNLRFALRLYHLQAQIEESAILSLTRIQVGAWQETYNKVLADYGRALELLGASALTEDEPLKLLFDETETAIAREQLILPHVEKVQALRAQVDGLQAIPENERANPITLCNAALVSLRTGPQPIVFRQGEKLEAELAALQAAIQSSAKATATANLARWTEAVRATPLASVNPDQLTQWQAQKTAWEAWSRDVGVLEDEGVHKALRQFSEGIEKFQRIQSLTEKLDGYLHLIEARRNEHLDYLVNWNRNIAASGNPEAFVGHYQNTYLPVQNNALDPLFSRFDNVLVVLKGVDAAAALPFEERRRRLKSRLDPINLPRHVPGTALDISDTILETEVASHIDPGNKYLYLKPEEHQQDVVIDLVTRDGKIKVYGVADGMGGYGGGAVAAGIVKAVWAQYVDFFREEMTNEEIKAAAQWILNQCIVQLNAARAQGLGSDGMGATFVAGIERKNEIIMLKVGDVRGVVKYTDGVVEQVTQDHAAAQTWLDLKIIPEDLAAIHPGRNFVTVVLQQGMSEAPLLDEASGSFAVLDKREIDEIAFTSDGIVDQYVLYAYHAHHPFPPSAVVAFQEVFDLGITPLEQAREFINRAWTYHKDPALRNPTESGSHLDNMSVVVVKVKHPTAAEIEENRRRDLDDKKTANKSALLTEINGHVQVLTNSLPTTVDGPWHTNWASISADLRSRVNTQGLSEDESVQTALTNLDLHLLAYISACSGIYPSDIKRFIPVLQSKNEAAYKSNPFYPIFRNTPELSNLRDLVLKNGAALLNGVEPLLLDVYGYSLMTRLQTQGWGIDDFRTMSPLERQLQLNLYFPTAVQEDQEAITVTAARKMGVDLGLASERPVAAAPLEPNSGTRSGQFGPTNVSQAHMVEFNRALAAGQFDKAREAVKALRTLGVTSPEEIRSLEWKLHRVEQPRERTRLPGGGVHAVFEELVDGEFRITMPGVPWSYFVTLEGDEVRIQEMTQDYHGTLMTVGERQAFKQGTPIEMGRDVDPRKGLQMSHDEISRHHARLTVTRENGLWDVRLEDIGSKNGTVIEWKRPFERPDLEPEMTRTGFTVRHLEEILADFAPPIPSEPEPRPGEGTFRIRSIAPGADAANIREKIREAISDRNGVPSLNVHVSNGLPGQVVAVKLNRNIPAVNLLPSDAAHRFPAIIKTLEMALTLLMNTPEHAREIAQAESHQTFLNTRSLRSAFSYHVFTDASPRQVLGLPDNPQTVVEGLDPHTRQYFLQNPGKLAEYLDSDVLRDVINDIGAKSENPPNLLRLLRNYLNNVYTFEQTQSRDTLVNALRALLGSSYKFAKSVEVGRVKVYSESKGQWLLDEKDSIPTLDGTTPMEISPGTELYDFIRKAVQNPKPGIQIFNSVFKHKGRLWVAAVRDGRPEIYYTSDTYSTVAGQPQWERLEAYLVKITEDGHAKGRWIGKPAPENQHEFPDSASAKLSSAVAAALKSGHAHFVEDSEQTGDLITNLTINIGIAFGPDGTGITRDKQGKPVKENPRDVLKLRIDRSRYPRWLLFGLRNSGDENLAKRIVAMLNPENSKEIEKPDSSTLETLDVIEKLTNAGFEGLSSVPAQQPTAPAPKPAVRTPIYTVLLNGKGVGVPPDENGLYRFRIGSQFFVINAVTTDVYVEVKGIPGSPINLKSYSLASLSYGKRNVLHMDSDASIEHDHGKITLDRSRKWILVQDREKPPVRTSTICMSSARPRGATVGAYGAVLMIIGPLVTLLVPYLHAVAPVIRALDPMAPALWMLVFAAGLLWASWGLIGPTVMTFLHTGANRRQLMGLVGGAAAAMRGMNSPLVPEAAAAGFADSDLVPSSVQNQVEDTRKQLIDNNPTAWAA